jgi:hypothetical protein
MALPPFAPAVKATCNWALPTIAEVVTVGALGVVAVVIDELAAEVTLDPMPLTAVTRKIYEVPLANPVTCVEIAVLVPSLKVLHVDPLSDEYSTT